MIGLLRCNDKEVNFGLQQSVSERLSRPRRLHPMRVTGLRRLRLFHRGKVQQHSMVIEQ
jgi:hypothetical protein